MTEKRMLLHSGNQVDITSICLNVQMRARVPLFGDRAEEVDRGPIVTLTVMFFSVFDFLLAD